MASVLKAIFSGVTRIYIRELVENVELAVELLVADATVRVAVVNERPDAAFVDAQQRKIRHNPDQRNQDQDQPGTHVNDVIQIGRVPEVVCKIITGKSEYGQRNNKEQRFHNWVI